MSATESKSLRCASVGKPDDLHPLAMVLVIEAAEKTGLIHAVRAPGSHNLDKHDFRFLNRSSWIETFLPSRSRNVKSSWALCFLPFCKTELIPAISPPAFFSPPSRVSRPVAPAKYYSRERILIFDLCGEQVGVLSVKTGELQRIAVHHAFQVAEIAGGVQECPRYAFSPFLLPNSPIREGKAFYHRAP